MFDSSEMRKRLSGALDGLLQETKDDSVEAFLSRYPGLPYVEVARNHRNLSGAALMRAQMREAIQTGRLRHAAMDALVREINSEFPQGWGMGNRIESRWANVWTFWVVGMKLEELSPDL